MRGGLVNCHGRSAHPQLLAHGSAWTFAALETYDPHDPQTIHDVMWVRSPGTGHSFTTLRRAGRAFLRRDRDMHVLVTVADGDLVERRRDDLSGEITQSSARRVTGEPFDVLYDSAGNLRVLSRSRDARATMLLDGMPVGQPSSAAGAAWLAGDELAIAYISPRAVDVSRPDAARALRLWTSAGIERELVTPASSGPDDETRTVAVAAHPSDGVIVSWDGAAPRWDAIGELWHVGLGVGHLPPAPPVAWQAPPCMDGVVSTGESCRGEQRNPAGAKRLDHGLVADETAGVWTISLLADATFTCRREPSCPSGPPCDCRITSETSYSNVRAVLQQLSDPGRSIELRLGALPRVGITPIPEAVPELALSPLHGSRLLVGVSWTRWHNGGELSHLAYVEVDLSPMRAP